jgi:hypothetical protein
MILWCTGSPTRLPTQRPSRTPTTLPTSKLNALHRLWIHRFSRHEERLLTPLTRAQPLRSCTIQGPYGRADPSALENVSVLTFGVFILKQSGA